MTADRLQLTADSRPVNRWPSKPKAIGPVGGGEEEEEGAGKEGGGGGKGRELR